MPVTQQKSRAQSTYPKYCTIRRGGATKLERLFVPRPCERSDHQSSPHNSQTRRNQTNCASRHRSTDDKACCSVQWVNSLREPTAADLNPASPAESESARLIFISKFGLRLVALPSSPSSFGKKWPGNNCRIGGHALACGFLGNRRLTPNAIYFGTNRDDFSGRAQALR